MELRDRRALVAELVLGALPFAGALACMALCLPSADAAAPVPRPPEIHALNAVPYTVPSRHHCTLGVHETWLLVAEDHFSVGMTRTDPDHTFWISRNRPPGVAWQILEGDLAQLHADRTYDASIRIAVESTDVAPVSYQDLITAMEVSTHAGLADIELPSPSQLLDLLHLRGEESLP